jgi:hypothetical protein
MIATVRRSPIHPPLLETSEASWIDIRDDQGYLVFFVIFMPGGTAFLTCSKEDQDFEATAKNFQIPLFVEQRK